MAKQYKCYFCKELINEKELYEYIDEKGNKKRSHNECYRNYIDRKEFYSYLYKILDIPSIDARTVFMIDNNRKNGYNYSVMLHALKIKQDAIVSNFSKGWGYTLAILKNQLPFSYRELEKERKLKEKQTKTDLVNKQEEVIISAKSNQPETKILDCEDISDL